MSIATTSLSNPAHNGKVDLKRGRARESQAEVGPSAFFLLSATRFENSGAQEQAVEVVLAHPLIGAAVLKQEAGKR